MTKKKQSSVNIACAKFLLIVLFMLFSVGVVSAVGSSPAVDPDMVLYYKFNNDSSVGESYALSNTTYDYSNAKNNGTMKLPIFYNSGSYLNDGYFSFTTSGSWVNASQPSSLNFTGKSFTVMAWVNASSLNAGPFRIMAKRNGNNGFLLYQSGTGYDFFIGNGTTNQIAVATDYVVKDTWQFVVGTYNGTTASLYVNGIFVQSKNIPNYQDATGFDLIIGNQADDGGLFNGSIDEPIILNTSLSATQVWNYYNTYQGCIIPTDQQGVGGSVTFCTGTYYLNGSNLAGGSGWAFRVIGNNAVINGNGSSLIGNLTAQSKGITVNGYSNITIKNFALIDKYQMAIRVDASAGNVDSFTIDNVTMGGNMLFSDTYFSSASSKKFTNLVFSNNIFNSSSNLSTSLAFFNDGASTNFTNISFINNKFYQVGTAVESISLTSFVNGNISGNEFFGSGLSGSYGIRLTGQHSNVEIYNNNISKNQYSISLGSTFGNAVNIHNNYIFNGDQGLVCNSFRGNAIINNNTFYNITMHYDGYDSALKLFNCQNIQITNNNFSYFGSAGIQSQLSSNITIINNQFEGIPFNQRTKFIATDTRDPPSAIRLTPLYKSYVGFALESTYLANIANLTQLISSNFNISGNTFDSNIQLPLWLQGAVNITQDINNYWYIKIQTPSYLIPPSEFFISNNFDNLSTYSNGEITINLGSGYNNKFFTNYTITKNYLSITNINSSTTYLNGFYNTSTALVYYGNLSSVCSDIPSCNGNINITLPPGNASYVLDNFNLTEGVTRENSPLWFSSSSDTSKHIASNLTDTVNITVVINVLSCENAGTITYTSDSGAYTHTYLRGKYDCNNNQATLNIDGIEQATGSNELLIEYGCNSFTRIGYSLVMLFASIMLVLGISMFIWKKYQDGDITVGDLVILFIVIIVSVTLWLTSGQILGASCGVVS